MKKALVTGGTGSVGPALVNYLKDKGWTVRVLVREKQPKCGFLQHVEQVKGDIKDPDSLKDAVAGVQIVFHLAACLHDNSKPGNLKEEYKNMNVNGTLNLFHTARYKNVERFIFFSTISVYEGQSAGREIRFFDESMKNLSPKSLYGKTKYEAELTIRKMAAHYPGYPAVTVLRLATVYGCRMKGNYRKLAGVIAKKGMFLCPGSGNNVRTLIHEEDAARAAFLAAVHPAAPGRVFNVTDASVHRIRDIVDSMALALEKNIVKLYFPSALVSVILSAVKRTIVFRLKSVREGVLMIEKLNENVDASGYKLMHDLGFNPKWSLEEGMKDALKTWKKRIN